MQVEGFVSVEKYGGNNDSEADQQDAAELREVIAVCLVGQQQFQCPLGREIKQQTRRIQVAHEVDQALCAFGASAPSCHLRHVCY